MMVPRDEATQADKGAKKECTEWWQEYIFGGSSGNKSSSVVVVVV